MTEPGYRLHWRETLAISRADPRKRESVILQLGWQGKRWTARLIPAWLDDCGEPVPAQGEVRERILERLREMSRQVGCAVELKNGEAYLVGEAE